MTTQRKGYHRPSGERYGVGTLGSPGSGGLKRKIARLKSIKSTVEERGYLATASHKHTATDWATD